MIISKISFDIQLGSLLTRWSIGWEHYLVTTKKIAFAYIDGRGTGFQSDEHLFKVYR
jgi:hypothetical protein